MSNKFIVDQKILLSILSSMQPICAKRTTLDATSSILFNISHKELDLKSTDLEISLQASCHVIDNDITEPQSFLVSGKRIFDLVKELDGTIEFSFDNQQLSLQSGAIHLALNIKSSEEFPSFPERIENLMQFDALFLQELLEKVAFLIPQNNANPSLNGLFLEVNAAGLTMTTTDGHCLAQVSTDKYKLEQEKKWLLPRRAVFELKKILDSSENKFIFLGTCGNQVVFSGDSFNFFTKLLTDQFPNYKPILDKTQFVPATIDRTHFLKTLRRSTCLLSGQFIATQFGFDKNILNVFIQNKEVGKLKEALTLEDFTGEQLDIRFYAPYLLNGLQAFSDEKVTFYLKNNAKPIIFEADQDKFHVKYLVMPVSPTTM